MDDNAKTSESGKIQPRKNLQIPEWLLVSLLLQKQSPE